MSQVIVKASVPVQAQVPSVSSTSKHIIRNRSVEVLPQAQTTYAYSGSDRIEFQIASSSDFLDAMNSYLRFELTCALAEADADDTTKYLAEGGAHSLFREIRLETAQGTIIERIEDYNKLYALMSQLTHSREHVDLVEQVSGDSKCLSINNDGVNVKTVVFFLGQYSCLMSFATYSRCILSLLYIYLHRVFLLRL